MIQPLELLADSNTKTRFLLLSKALKKRGMTLHWRTEMTPTGGIWYITG